eukprot:COSAG05_NODE_754_length_7519_cov_4.955256_10_plen_97_part_00
MSARKPKPQPEPEPEPGQGLGLGPEPELGLKCPVVSQGLGAAVRQICGASPEIGIKALVSAVKQQFPGKPNNNPAHFVPSKLARAGPEQTRTVALW